MVERSSFGIEFVAVRLACNQIEALRYRLRMLGTPLDGEVDAYCDSGSVVVNAQHLEERLN